MPKRRYAVGPSNRIPKGPTSAVRPKSNHWDPYEESFLIDPTVFEDDGPDWVPSGLLDADGQPILVLVGGKDPIGYLWHDENGELRPRDAVIERLTGDIGE